MDTKVYYGVFDFDGWKAAIADGEVEKHLICSYYAAWVNPDGRLHAVNYHEAYNSAGTGRDAAYATNFANRLVRWYGSERGEMGIQWEGSLTKEQADMLIKLVYTLNPRNMYFSGVGDETDKSGMVAQIRRLQY